MLHLTSLPILFVCLNSLLWVNSCVYQQHATNNRTNLRSPHNIINNHRRLQDHSLSSPISPYCYKTNGAVVAPSSSNVCQAYHGIKQSYYSQLPTNDFDLSDVFGQSIRLAFHDAAEADLTKSGDVLGPDGCISDSPLSNGLLEADSYVTTLLEPIWQNYCDLISRGDFWALIGKLAVEKAERRSVVTIPYRYGRVDSANCQSGAGRLPDAQMDFNGLTRFFVAQLGLTIFDAGT